MAKTSTILAVDDSAVALHMYRLLLSPTYHLLTAGNGVEALEKLQKNADVELVVLDINMPRMNGFEFLQAVRKSPLYRSLRILVISTQGKEEDAGLALSLGATGYLTKPFEPLGLLRIIEASLPGFKDRRSTTRLSWFQQPASGNRRIDCNELCAVSFGPQRSQGVVWNLSAQGLYLVLAAAPLPIRGDMVRLTFSLSGDLDPITCEGRVAWVNPSACSSGSGAVATGLPGGCGVTFTQLEPADRERIEARVKAAFPAKKR